MDTRYLTYILTIARKKNMTKAAEELFVSQSSLSQYLTKLEQELGTPLYFRARGELVLTPAGQLYTEAAQRVIQIKEQLYKDIANLDNKGHITIGCTSQFALLALTEIVPKFKAFYPDWRVEITEQSLPALTKMLLEENIDLGLMAANTVKPFDKEYADVLERRKCSSPCPPTTHIPEKIRMAPSGRRNSSNASGMRTFFCPGRAPLFGCWPTSCLRSMGLSPVPCVRPTASWLPRSWSPTAAA